MRCSARLTLGRLFVSVMLGLAGAAAALRGWQPFGVAGVSPPGAFAAAGTVVGKHDRDRVSPLAQEIDNLPLRDALVVAFPHDWRGSGRRPYGVFFDPAKYNGAPITADWQDRVLKIQVAPGPEPVGWHLKITHGTRDWSEFQPWQLAVRVRFSEPMYRRFRVELKGDGRQKLSWDADLTDEEMEAMRHRGFGDFLLPLSDAKSGKELQVIDELVISFERQRTTTVGGDAARGELRLHSLRLIPPRSPHLAPRARLDNLAERAFDWFEHYRDPRSGLVPDRAPNRREMGIATERQLICSIASVGYYLSMLPDAVASGRLSEAEARDRVLTVLRFLAAHADHHHGLLYHFLDMTTGQALPNTEVSALDSAIFFNGCMVVGVRFGGEVAEVADYLMGRVDWSAFRLPPSGGRPALLSLGWKPDTGLLGPMDVRSAEFIMPYVLAVGAEKGGVEPQLWWNTTVVNGTVAGRRVLNPTHGLFTSYYGLGWMKLLGFRDRDGVDLWQNAVEAALANREFCRRERSESYATMWGGWWGISAGDAPAGYVAPGTVEGDAGGTVWPMAALAALPWAEAQIEEDLRAWETSPVWDDVSGPFGLAPFNLGQRWVGEDVIGIDLGSFYLAVANQRRGTVWDLWMRHAVARRGLQRLYGSP